MPICRVKPSTGLISEELLNEIKAIRPLRLFINKQKKKGIVDKPFNLRVKFCKLSQDKQAKFLQKSVDLYIDLLDERDVDESVQIKCRLFDYLLAKKEQKRYFQSINAPIKPPGKVASSLNQNSFDNDSDASWKSSTIDEQKAHRHRRKEAKSAYAAQARNFANDLPDRLRTDYLLCSNLIVDTCSSSPKNSQNGSIRQRRKSLTALPESLQTEPIVDTHQTKLTRSQLDELHRFLPHELYYEKELNNSHKREFPTRTSKNGHTRALFNRLTSEQRLKYILKSIDKWNGFLKSNPSIIDNQIPTLHLLLPKNEEILLYFSSLGFPQRPPFNSYLLYQLEPASSDQAWSDLTEKERQKYIQELKELKIDYYKQLIDFVDDQLPNDYLRYEFFRNIKYAVRDYELALKTHTNESCSSLTKDHEKKIIFNSDRRQFQQIKQKLLATQLTHEQKNLVEELSDLLSKYIE